MSSRLLSMLKWLPVTLFIFVMATCAMAAGAAESIYLLKPARVFDATTEQTHAGWAVLVRGERIESVGPVERLAPLAGTQTIELPDMTLLPGLIDTHSHIFLHPYDEA